MTSSAQSGFYEAQAELGILYRDGYAPTDDESILEKDLGKALYFLELAVAQNHAGAMVELALYYNDDNNKDRNPKMGLKYLFEAIKKNSLRAEYVLGCWYKEGYGVQENLEKAVFWLSRVAEKGVWQAALMLARIYANKKLSVIHFNYDKAVAWFDKAISICDIIIDERIGISTPEEEEMKNEKNIIEEERNDFTMRNMWHGKS